VRAILGLIFGATLLLAFTALTGNADAIDPAAIQDTAAIPTPLHDPIGQTFIARTPRLSAIQILWSIPANYTPPRDQRVTLHLRASPAAERDLATASIPLDQIRNNGFSKFSFTPIPDSENQPYYFFFDTDAPTLALWSSGQDAYADGALYINSVPTPRDLSFRIYYEPDLGMLARALAQTLARFPIPIFFFALFAFSFAAFALRPFAPFAFQYLFAFLALLAIATALLQIRDLPAPLWVDSLTHAQYVQFILDQARLPTENFYHLGFHVLAALVSKSLKLSISNSLLLTGQFSWVSVGIAVFFLSRKIFRYAEAAPTPSASLGALAAAVCVWFLSPTPAYFITWGRYPLVLGSALLALALLWTVKLFEQRNARNLFIAALSFGILAFTQIRLAGFYVAFVAIYLGMSFRGSRATEKSHPTNNEISRGVYPELVEGLLKNLILWGRRLVRRCGLAASATGSRPSFCPDTRCARRETLRVEMTMGGTQPLSANPSTPLRAGFQFPISKQSLILSISFVFIPVLWLIYLFAGGVTPQSILAQNQAAPSIDLQTAFDVIFTHHGVEFLILATLSAILGLARRSRVAFLMLGWVAALSAMALTLRAPILGELVPPSLIVLMAFLPAAILIGDAARFAYERSGAPHRFVHAAIWVALIGCVSILGARDMVNLANPATILFTRADDRAMEWIGANVPRHRSAKFLVNSFNWVGTTFVPSDGGGWIPFFTSHPIEYLDAAAKDDSEFARRQWMAEHQIKYIYLAPRAGTLGAAEFIAQPENFSLVYDSAGVKIFQIR